MVENTMLAMIRWNTLTSDSSNKPVSKVLDQFLSEQSIESIKDNMEALFPLLPQSMYKWLVWSATRLTVSDRPVLQKVSEVFNSIFRMHSHQVWLGDFASLLKYAGTSQFPEYMAVTHSRIYLKQFEHFDLGAEDRNIEVLKKIQPSECLLAIKLMDKFKITSDEKRKSLAIHFLKKADVLKIYTHDVVRAVIDCRDIDWKAVVNIFSPYFEKNLHVLSEFLELKVSNNREEFNQEYPSLSNKVSNYEKGEELLELLENQEVEKLKKALNEIQLRLGLHEFILSLCRYQPSLFDHLAQSKPEIIQNLSTYFPFGEAKITSKKVIFILSGLYTFPVSSLEAFASYNKFNTSIKNRKPFKHVVAVIDNDQVFLDMVDDNECHKSLFFWMQFVNKELFCKIVAKLSYHETLALLMSLVVPAQSDNHRNRFESGKLRILTNLKEKKNSRLRDKKLTEVVQEELNSKILPSDAYANLLAALFSWNGDDLSAPLDELNKLINYIQRYKNYLDRFFP